MKTRKLTALMRKIYAKYPTGGALHIVLDDYNVDDVSIFWCINNMAYGDKLDSGDYELFYECAGLLLSIKERRRAGVIDKAFKKLREA